MGQITPNQTASKTKNPIKFSKPFVFQDSQSTIVNDSNFYRYRQEFPSVNLTLSTVVHQVSNSADSQRKSGCAEIFYYKKLNYSYFALLLCFHSKTFSARFIVGRRRKKAKWFKCLASVLGGMGLYIIGYDVAVALKIVENSSHDG